VKKALVLVVLLLAVFVGEMLMFDNHTHSQDKAPFIAVTSYPLYEIADRLIGKEIEIEKLIPNGVEIHTYRPSVKTMSMLSNAKLMVYNGLGIEPWIKKEYSNALDMSHFVKLNKNDVEHHHSHDHHEEDADPHYWLDVQNMMKMTEVLNDKLNSLFPQHKEVVDKNAAIYINELQVLEKSYQKAFKSCKGNEIVVNHNAFGYISQRYGFEVHSLTGLSPDEQVSAKKMKEITDLVNEEGIKVIFFESFVSPKVSETISKETGARVESLQPLANVSSDEATKGYVLIMQENLKKLSSAMECE